MKSLTLLANPRSRRFRLFPHEFDRMATRTRSWGQVETPNGLRALSQAIQRAKEQQLEVLAIYGGDGTLHRTVTALSEVYGSTPWPSLAFLGGGTMNTICKSLGIKDAPVERLERLLALREDGQRNIDHASLMLSTLSIECKGVNDSASAPDRAVGFIFGTGLVTNFLERYYQRHRPSTRTAFAMAFRSALSPLLDRRLYHALQKREVLELQPDEGPTSSAAFLVLAAATVPEIGLGFRPFSHAFKPPVGPALYAWHGELRELLMQLPNLYFGRHHGGAHCASKFDSITLQPTEPMRYTVDGDLYQTSTAIRLCRGPHIRLLPLKAEPLLTLPRLFHRKNDHNAPTSYGHP